MGGGTSSTQWGEAADKLFPDYRKKEKGRIVTEVFGKYSKTPLSYFDRKSDKAWSSLSQPISNTVFQISEERKIMLKLKMIKLAQKQSRIKSNV